MLENLVPAARTTVDAADAGQRPAVALSVDTRVILGSASAGMQFREQVGDILGRSLPLSVTLTGLDSGARAYDRMRRVCSRIAECASANATSPRDLEVIVGAGAMQPDRAWSARSGELETGPLYLLAGAQDIRAYIENRARYRRFWQRLWQLQSQRELRLACAPLVRSRCPLLPHEVGAVVLPQAAVQVPERSAWFTRSIDLCRFADVNGVLDRALLRDELQRSIDAVLAAHLHADWPSASLQHDSWLNRRYALYVSGIGDLVVRRRQDPRDLASLASLRDALRWMQSTLVQHSRRLAVSGNIMPAIRRFESPHTLGRNRDRWEASWCAALAEHAAACRIVLVLSPWSVFPRRIAADPAFLNLLPLLEFADACAFPAAPQLTGWNIKDFMQLYQRTWATLERRRGI